MQIIKKWLWRKPAVETRERPLAEKAYHGGAFHFSDEAYVQNPYPYFDYLRSEQPVFRMPTGAWLMTRYEDVYAAFGDARFGNAPSPYAVLHDRNREKYVCADVATNILPFLDPPRHGMIRQLVAKAFHTHLKHHPLDYESYLMELVAKERNKGNIEIVSEIGTPFSLWVMREMLGISAQDEHLLKGWSEQFFYLFAAMPSEEIREQVDVALTEFRNYFTGHVSRCRKSPETDLVSAMCQVEDKGFTLSDREIVDNCMLLFADGIENVDRAIGNAIWALLSHPDEWLKLKENPEYIKSAVEECLRYEAPAQFVGKVAREDISLHGQQIRKHSGILLMVGSANRDPEQFEKPDRLNIARNPNRHLSFGRGVHACVGGYLVKREMQAALRVMIQQIPNMDLPKEEVAWVPRAAHRWIQSVKVSV